MPQNPLALEFSNANAVRRYPLTADSSGVDQSGDFKLPVSFLIHLDVPIHYGLAVDPSRFFLMQLGVYATGFSILVGYQPADDSDPIPVAASSVLRSTHTPGLTYALSGIGDFADTVGKVTLGRLDDIDDQPPGLFNFDLTDARIEPDCVRPLIRGVSSLRVSSGTDVSDRVYGDVELVAEENMQISVSLVEGQDPRIIFSAIEGEGLREDCECEGATEIPCLRRINGVGGDEDGNLDVVGNDCLTIAPLEHGLQLNDECSKPCCGCEELERITRDLELFGQQAQTLGNFVTGLEASVRSMDQVVLGSKLGDRNCAEPCE